jgi:hypothetical protein
VLLDRRRLIEWIFEPLLSLAWPRLMEILADLQFGARRKLPVFLQTRRRSAALRAWA